MRFFKPPVERAPAFEEKLTLPPVAFSRPVDEGYVDSTGRWFSTKREADVSSATDFMVARIFQSTKYYDPTISPWSILKEPEIIRAMAILGASA